MGSLERHRISTCRMRFSIAGLVVFAAVLVSGCGGGGGGADNGGGGGGTFPAKILSWIPPTTYSDSTPLIPARDLDAFEIYITDRGSFSQSDSPAALVAAIDPGTGQVSTSFNLANLGPFLSKGVNYQVSIRAVAITGLKSDFSPAASFSF